MASGHMNRVKRPNTWLHRPMLQNVKKVLANSEPSTQFRKSATFYNSVLRYESAREDGVPRPAYAPSRASLIFKVMIAPVGGQLADIVPPS
jgi:hypothetical protein